VLEKNKDTIKIVFKHFPLNMHDFAKPAAEAAVAAQRQGKFWPYHDLLFKNYKKLNAELIESLAVEAGLDKARFDADRKDPKVKAQVQKDYNDAIQAGVRGTPTFFINGVQVKDRSLSGFQQLVDKALQKLAEKN
jgi:protein-disulfide isomerase